MAVDGKNLSGDDRTFRVNFVGDGASRLRERVKEKLKEFMGDYTDDTLVEYVIVLLRNGRRKDEARRELNVFLGDDSASFISWLWDHLSSNLDLYIQPKENRMDELSGRHSSQPENVSGNMQTDSDYLREKSNRVSGSRRNREWKGLMQESELFPLRSSLTDIVHSEERSHIRSNLASRSRSPVLQGHKKRSRQEGQPMKRDTSSHPVIGAPRRLLQFAVRDAVRTVQQSTSRIEPPSKRLRSVVSMSITDSRLDDKSHGTSSVARVPGLSTALRAAVDAADDVKSKSLGSVFDRLRHGVVTTVPINHLSDVRGHELEDGEYEDFDQISGSHAVDYHQRKNYDGKYAGDMTMSDRDADSASDNDGYDSVGIVRQQGLGVSQSASSANKEKRSVEVHHNVSLNADEVARNTKLMDPDPATSAASKPSSKIVNISVNVNTWKPPHYQATRDITEVENRIAVDKNVVSAGKTNVRVQQENDTPMAENEKKIVGTDVQKEFQKTVPSTSGSYVTRPSDDVDSRTVFVSNVHFAATKDTLSRHFNKFGEVLKVIIMTDAATGQPTGSAYVEFLRKESAELALSLNSTSFMSRLLKVVRRSAAHHEAAPMGWPRIPRASPFASMVGRMAYPRGTFAGAFRGRPPLKPGARSLQWKRGVSTAQSAGSPKGLQNPSTPGNNLTSPTGRNLTYVRAEAKAGGNAGSA